MTDLATMQRAIQAWVERADGDPRCKALWLEGESPAAIRRHTGAVDLHLGVEDPDFDHFAGALPEFLAAAGAVQPQADGPAEPDAFALVAEVAGVGTVTCTLERMSLVGKRPRSAVQPLFDRTHRLRNVMDYSGARRPAAPSKEEPVARHPDLLSRDVVAAALSRLPNWKRHGDEILATYRVRKFLSGVTLAGKAALAAEAADHHPDILIRFREVSFSLTTHEAGGLTQKDLDLAAQIEGLAEEVERGRAAAPAKKAKKAKKKAAKKAKKKAAPKKKAKKKAKKSAKKAAKKKPAAKKKKAAKAKKKKKR